jgi:hypothetical protein
MINEYKILVGKHEGTRSLGRSRRTREDYIKMEKKIGLEGVDWIYLAQDRGR